MPTSRATSTYAAALNRNQLFANYGLQQDIPKLLHADEEVLLVLPGVAGDFPNVLVAASNRVLLAAVAGPIKRAKVKREVPASAITGVQYRSGVFTRIHVQTSLGRDIRMLPNHHDDAERFAFEFGHLLRTGRLPA